MPDPLCPSIAADCSLPVNRALADMFKGDPAAYAVAKSRLEMVSSINMIICPLIGARLAQISLRLPWAVCGVSFSVMVVVAIKFLRETLPESERVPFRWKGSNPLSCECSNGQVAVTVARLLRDVERCCEQSSSSSGAATRCGCWRSLRSGTPSAGASPPTATRVNDDTFSICRICPSR